MVFDTLRAVVHRLPACLSRNFLRPLVKGTVYTVRHGFAKGLKRRGGLDFMPWPPTAEEAFLRALDLTGKTVYDAGAFEGLYTVAFARAVGDGGAVIAFEPNLRNVTQVQENIALNGFANVRVIPIALGNACERRTLTAPRGEPGMGTVQHATASRYCRQRRTSAFECAVDTLDNQFLAHGLRPPDFVKIDVEGFEWEVLQGMSGLLERHRPDLLIEVHGRHAVDGAGSANAIVDMLTAQGYRLQHVESGRQVDTGTTIGIGRNVHLYAEAGVSMKR